MKTDQIQLRRILLVIETGRCYEYKGEYYEHLGTVSVVDFRFGFNVKHDRFRIIGKNDKEYAANSDDFNREFNKVTDPQKVMQEFGAIYQPTINTETAEKSGK